jgi:hypothetical protein
METVYIVIGVVIFWGQVDLRAKGGGCPKMSFDRWDDAQAFEDRVRHAWSRGGPEAVTSVLDDYKLAKGNPRGTARPGYSFREIAENRHTGLLTIFAKSVGPGVSAENSSRRRGSIGAARYVAHDPFKRVASAAATSIPSGCSIVAQRSPRLRASAS